MGWIMSLFLVVYYFVSREPVTLLAASFFGIAGALSYIGLNIEKFYKLHEKRQESGNKIFEYLKFLGTQNKQKEQDKERV